jgi:hypothetical protein
MIQKNKQFVDYAAPLSYSKEQLELHEMTRQTCNAVLERHSTAVENWLEETISDIYSNSIDLKNENVVNLVRERFEVVVTQYEQTDSLDTTHYIECYTLTDMLTNDEYKMNFVKYSFDRGSYYKPSYGSY